MSDAVPPPPAPQAAPASGEDKTVAILAYVTPLLCLVGFVIAILMHNKAKTKLGAYHLRQSLGLIVISLLGLIPILGILISVAVFVLWILALVSAINGQEKPVPLVGEHFQKWFATVFE